VNPAKDGHAVSRQLRVLKFKTMLNTTHTLETAWNQMKRRLKQKFAGLLYADLAYAENDQHRMFMRLQTKLGKTKQELAQIVAAL